MVVLDAQGKLLMQVTLRTEASVLLDFIRGLSATLYLTLEEGTYSAWLYDLLSSLVAVSSNRATRAQCCEDATASSSCCLGVREGILAQRSWEADSPTKCRH